MDRKRDSRLDLWLGRVPKAASAISIFGALVVLSGWMIRIPILRSFFPNQPPMRPNAALCIIFVGVSLWLLHEERSAGARRFRRHLAAQLLAAATAIIGLWSLSESLLGVDLGTDRLLFHNFPTAFGGPHPFRIPPASAFGFVLMGGALLLLDRRTRGGDRPAEFLAFVAILDGVFGVLDYVLNPAVHSTGMALNASLLFIVLGSGLFSVCAGPRLRALMATQGFAATAVHHMFPAAMILPVSIGWVAWLGERAGLFGNDEGLVLTVVMSIAVLALVVVWTAEHLEQREVEIHALNEQFEQRVIDRTAQLAAANIQLRGEITDRQRAEEALRASEEQFRVLSEAMPQIVWSADATGALDYLNPHAYEYGGVLPEPAQGWKWASFVHPEDLEPTMSVWRQALASGEAATIEHRLRRADGEFRWHLTRAVPVRDAEGKVVRWIGTATDIHENKLAEEELERRVEERTAELAKSMALLETVTSNAPVILFATDAQGIITLHTGKAVPATGRAAGEVIGRNYREAASFNPQVQDGIRRALDGEGFTAVAEGPDDTSFETLYAPLRDAEGEITGMIGLSLDITERKRADAALSESEEKYRTLFDSIDEGFCTIEVLFDANNKPMDYQFLEINPSFEKQTGIQNARGRRMREIAPQHEEYWFEIYGKIALTGEPARFENEAAQLHRWYDVYAFRIGDPHQNNVAILFNDITERKRADAALRESQALTTTIVDSTSDMIWSVDAESFGLLTFNRGMRDNILRRGVRLQTGMSPEEVFIDKDLAGRWRGLYRRALLEDHYTIDYASPTGGILQVTLNLLKRDGKIFGISVFGKDVTERKRAEAALQDSEAAFHNLAESVPQLVWMCTPEGLNIYFNQRWVDYTGLTLEESYGRGWSTPFHPEDKQAAWDAWNHAVENSNIYSIECRLLRADGAYRWFLNRGVPLCDATGRIVRWFGTCTDIDDLKRAEVELRRLNRALRTLSECNKAVVHARDESELLQEICRILVQEGGYRLAWVGFAEQDEAKTVRPVAHAGLEEGYLETIKITWADTERGRGPTGAAIRTGQIAICRDMREDPGYAPWRDEAIRRGFASSITLPLALDGQTAGVLTAYSQAADAFDVTETQLLTELSSDLAYGIRTLRTREVRARIQEALSRANAYNRSLIEASRDPLVTISPKGKVTDVNRATELVTGLSREELIGTDFTNYFTNPDMARGAYEQVLREGWMQDYDLEIWHRDGHLIPVEFNASLYRDEAGQVIGVFAAARDITDRKGMEEELRRFSGRLLEAQDDERRRIARELHDSTIQNLAAIALNLDLVKRSAQMDEDGWKYLAESLSLLELSLNELRNITYLLHPPLLDEMGLSSALAFYVDGFSRRSRISVALEISPDLGRLPKDAERALFRVVQECLTNILRHARSATARITIGRNPEGIVLEVVDQGRGMLTSSSQGPGGMPVSLGVGIPGMRERVRLLGGKFEIDSGTQGTAVRVTFPFSESGLKAGG